MSTLRLYNLFGYTGIRKILNWVGLSTINNSTERIYRFLVTNMKEAQSILQLSAQIKFFPKCQSSRVKKPFLKFPGSNYVFSHLLTEGLIDSRKPLR